MANSFYGGLSGQSFAIKKIFTSRHQMEMDLGNGWTSSVGVGEFVMVSYGMQNEPNYSIYKKEDQKYYDGKTYNSTLWQKIYDETDGRAANGLSYKLIVSMSGGTPKLSLAEPPVEILDAGQRPEVIQNNSDIDNVTLKFKLPRSQTISLGTTKTLHHNQTPSVSINKDDINNPVLSFSLPQALKISVNGSPTVLNCDQKPSVSVDKSNIDSHIINFSLPQSQAIESATVKWLKVGQKPSVRLNTTNINRPVLEFSLPVAQSLKQGTTTVLNANKDPYFYINFANVDAPVLDFFLPQSQVMANPVVTVDGPTVNPNVVLNSSNINSPKLEFTLPRAVRFYYGSLLGERSDNTYTITNQEFADYAVGDFYINARTGFIYKVTAKNGNTCEFTYTACIQAPLPDVGTTAMNPFKANEEGNFVPAEPSVTRTFTNSELTAWRLNFKLPKTPNPEFNYKFVGPGEDGDVSVTPSAEDKVRFNFKIPQGSKIFAGDEVKGEDPYQILDSIVGGAAPGDLYLNTVTGAVYKLDKGKVWRFQNDGLKGSPGDALNIVREYRIEAEDDFDTGLNYIKAHYVDDKKVPLPYAADELFAVIFINATDNIETSYWYFYTEEGKWGRVQLTGGVYNLILDSYTNSTEENPVSNKTYSVDYINKLIGDEITDENKKKTTFSKEQIYALLSWGTVQQAKDGSWWPAE